LSYTQMFGKNQRIKDMEPEDTQLDIYKLRRNRVKGYGVDNNDYCYYWLRSPGTGSTANFGLVHSGGGSGSSGASGTHGVCFGFRIQSKNQSSEEEAAT